MKRLIRRLERFVITNICLSISIAMLVGVVIATPVWVALLHYVVFPAAVAEQDMRLAIAEGKRVVVTLSGTDRNCLEWRERNGAWSCVRR